ncbi:hypothetical protein [Aeromonas caviae]|uniref:hypothetical protein n=1 Tax=Aeromonas caviae TaxID=648 RepID=UPI000FEBFDE9|nr:hypothetical protein [Aeromonas caviae]
MSTAPFFSVLLLSFIKSRTPHELARIMLFIFAARFLAPIKKADKVGQRRAYAQENNLEDDRVNDLRNTRGVYQEENFSFDRTRRNSEHPIVPSCLPGRPEQPPFSFSQTLQT